MQRRVHILSSKPEVEDIEEAVLFPTVNDGWSDTINDMISQAKLTKDETLAYIQDLL